MARKNEKQTSARAKKRWLFRIITFVAVLVLGLELSLQVAHIAARESLPEGATRPNAPVILCLGDSHTYGAGVSRQEAYPARLEKKLAENGFAAEVINLGAPGTNTSEIRKKLPGWMDRYDPVCVIVLAAVNNSWNHHFAAWSDARDGLSTSTIERLQEELWNRIMILRGVNVLLHRLKWARAPEELARDRTGRTVLHRKRPDEPEPGENINRARRDLEAIIQTVRDRHAVPVLMTYVTGPGYSFTGCNPLLRRMAKRYGAPLADNDKALQKRMQKPDGSFDSKARQKLFFPDMHPRAAGYDLIAQNVYKTLERNGVLKLLQKKRED